MRKILAIIFMCLLSSSIAAGIGKAWDVSPAASSSNEDLVNPLWPRLDLSAFEVRSISGIGRLASREYFSSVKKNPELQRNREEIVISNESSKNNIAKEVEDMENGFTPEILYDHHPIFTGLTKNSRKDVEILPGTWEKSRRRGRTGRNGGQCPESIEDVDDSSSTEEIDERPRLRREVDETDMKKISETKNVREPRLNSPESWSKQPLSIEFHHRSNINEGSNEENDSSRAQLRSNHQPPQADFITANRRNIIDARESRDLPMSRSFDESPYRNNIRDRSLDMSYPTNYYYPGAVRTEREYFIRGLNEPNTAFGAAERYRIEDFDLYRNRPTPKPKRIIYYATLPEVVRKPVDLRTYSRPYDTMGRASTPSINRDGIYKRLPGMMDSRYRYRSYPYGVSSFDPYDTYIKKSNYQERPFVSYNDRIDEDRYRQQDLDHASFKEAARNDEATIPNLNVAGPRRGQDKLPWPVQIGTEINVKDNQRVTGRKIFGQQQDFERFRPSTRIERGDNEESIGLDDGRN